MTLVRGERVFVTGATGVVGQAVCAQLIERGIEVVALSRRPRGPFEGGVFVQGDVGQPGSWQEALEGVAGVVHLAGEPIAAARWNASVKARIRASRLQGTRNIVEAFEQTRIRPRVLVCASAAGFYGPRGEEELDERASPGEDFLARLCVDWEAEAQRAASDESRVVSLRFGMILSRHGGALPRMLPVFRLGLGGPLGPSDRFTPWIHERDAAGLALAALDQAVPGWQGPVNAVAPEQLRMGEWARILGRVLGRPAWIPVPEMALRAMLGESAIAVVPGQRIVPRAAQRGQYSFVYPRLKDALTQLLVSQP